MVLWLQLQEAVDVRGEGQRLPACRPLTEHGGRRFVELLASTLQLHLLLNRVGNGSHKGRGVIFLVVIDNIKVHLHPLDHVP